MIWGSGAFQERRGASCRAWSWRVLRAALLATAGLAAIGAGAGRAETINGALIKAYLTNPDINTQRAAVRVADENVPKANAGICRTSSARATWQWPIDTRQIVIPRLGVHQLLGRVKPRGYGVTANETVYNGGRTSIPSVRPKSQVLGAREQLRNTEQNTLLSGVTAYMDVLEDTAILDLDNNNVQVLQEQLRETRDRFTVGEVTRTDVAQAEASLASAQAIALSAVATLQAAVATYRQFIGDQPTSLAPVKPIVRPLPKTLPEAITISQVEHPAITARCTASTRRSCRSRSPRARSTRQVSVSASASNQLRCERHSGAKDVSMAEIIGQITIPIYQGGAEYASIRQSKESLTAQELRADSTRNQIRQNVVAAWGLNEASVGVVRAARAAVSANEVALTGVREEAKVGQRTTLDVLNAQQALLQARTTLVQAEHDQVVNSYSLLSAIGRLNIPTLGLSVAEYDPRVHFDQVKSKWIGLRTPSGQ